jgi:2-keto-4-pentenoate hydratase/2-oxohepta-3-ene-1,7-dioic acid hydratase in catechol pathway
VGLIVRYVESGTATPAYGVVDDGMIVGIEPHPFTQHRPTGTRLPLEAVRLVAPVIPSKVVCVGRNYAAHARELGGEVPEQPLLFLKPATSVIGPYESIRIPTDQTDEVHFEGELAVVIGRLVSDVTAEDARAAIAGYTCANDVTARDLQRRDDQWTRAKGFDTFCPLGPAIATDLDVGDLRLRTSVDGETRQDASTAEMVIGPAELVSYISRIMTLLPGDVVLTGTPEGVGPITPGHRVRVEIDGIGLLENPVTAR